MAAHNLVDWLLCTTNEMVRCRDIPVLLDLAYDAIRDGLGYDRIGLMLVERERGMLVEHIGTDAEGNRFYSTRDVALGGCAHYDEILADPRIGAGGPGFIYLEDASREVAPEALEFLDGRPGQTLCVALRTASGVIGLIFVDNLIRGRPISPTDAPPLVAFANALATAVENVSLLREREQRIEYLDGDLRRRVEQLTWLQEAGKRLSGAHGLEDVLDTIYWSVRDGLGYDRVGIFLVEEDYRQRRYLRELLGTDAHGQAHTSWSNRDYLDDPQLSLHSPDIHHLLQGHAWYYCPDRWASTPEAYRGAIEGRMREQIAVALRHDELMVGMISVDNLTSGRPISAEDAPPLVAYASQAAVAIGRARLWSAHARQSEGLARRITELEWLREISRHLNEARTLDEVLDVVYDGVRQGLGYDRVGICLFDFTQGYLDRGRGSDAEGRKVEHTSRRVGFSPDSDIRRFPAVAALLAGAEYYYTADATGECPPDLVHYYNGRPTHNLTVPLRSGSGLIGTISVDNLLSGRPLSRDDAGPLLALAHQVGTAVESARLHERERAEHMRLQTVLESARALNSSLDHDRILHELAACLRKALSAASVAFLQVNFTTRRTQVLACHIDAAHAAQYTLLLQDTALDDYPVVEEILVTRRPFYGHHDDEDFPDSERSFLQGAGLRAEMLVPVIVQGEANYLLEIGWTDDVAPSTDTLALCQAIAEQAAVALENARLYADAAQRAERDALTGLLNHRALLREIDAYLERDTPFALLLIDVDNFKLFNDTHGHPTGDDVLRRVAATLHETCRSQDIAGRYGGDEFALLLHGTGTEEAGAVVQRLHAGIETHPYLAVDGTVIPLSISVGWACYPSDGQTRPSLVAVADAAMYAAKHGRQRAPQRVAADLLGDSPFGMLEGLVNAVDAKDRYTCEHSEDVTRLALMLVEALELSSEERRVLSVAGPLHDVGKIAVPDRILRKPGRLSAEEYEILKRHVIFGVAIIKGVLDDQAVIDAVAYHHERWDGRGYPYGRSGLETPLLGRIMQLADAVSAMTMDRPYRRALSWGQVVDELRAGAGEQFDPALVEVFVTAIRYRYHRTA
jgi:diguanylate cyclase (GGDEF)-like protein/putative nucleotidyltransferase with HDIG domain